MKNKKIVVLFTMFIFLLIIGIVLFFLFFKNKTTFEQEKKEQGNYSQNKYICIIETDWVPFDFLGENGVDIGDYKKISQFQFEINEKKELINTVMEEQYVFSNPLGLDYLKRELDGFEEEVKEEELKKIYRSKTLLPISMEIFINNENPINDYINAIENLDYTCEKQ